MGAFDFTLVIPSLDPDEKLTLTVQSAIEAGIDDILLVDDGSKPENKHYFTALEQLPQVTLLTHEVNRGKGAALKTAFSYFLAHRSGRSGVVTADGDGQHRTEDIIACGRELSAGDPAVILGCRDFSLEQVPPRSRFGNRTTAMVFRVFCGMHLSDTQTGLRAIPAEYLPTLLTARGTRYEYETNMLLMLGEKNIPYREVRIETIYFEENKASHFRTVRDSVRVYGLILKYMASSLFASGLDLLLFFLFGLLLFRDGTRLDTFLTTALARCLSAAANFTLNRKVVFKSRAGVATTILRYICLAVPVMLTSWLCVYLLSDVLAVRSAILRTLIKIPVDLILFLISFRVQHAWVFKEK